MTAVGLMARKSVSDIIASGDAEGRSLAKALGPFSISGVALAGLLVVAAIA